MGKTSTAVKRRYNEKTYQRWFADIRKDDFAEIEALRGEMSRATFLKKLIQIYKDHESTSAKE